MFGRNTGKVGRLKFVETKSVYVDFGGEILVNEGFGSIGKYSDAYWVPIDKVVPLSA
jgi:hypothetical protein